MCTCFEEPAYKDIHDLVSHLSTNIQKIKLSNPQQTTFLKKKIKETIADIQTLIEAAVIANTTGKNLLKARGLSIYLPANKISTSYRSTPFGKNNKWTELISLLI